MWRTGTVGGCKVWTGDRPDSAGRRGKMDVITITVRFRGEFRELAGQDALLVRLRAGDRVGCPTLRRLVSAIGRHTPDARARHAIRESAFFCEGRLLRPDELAWRRLGSRCREDLGTHDD